MSEDVERDHVEPHGHPSRIPFLEGPPTEPGVYWYVTSKSRLVVEVVVAGKKMGRDVLGGREVGSCLRPARSIKDWSGKWAGPLPEPHE